MNKNKDQINSYSKLIVYELHKVIFDEAVFDKIKAVLALAEEMENYILNMERTNDQSSNVISFDRFRNSLSAVR